MAALRMIEGDRPGTVFRLDKDETVIGKAADCDISLSDAHVSKMHAKIIRKPDGFYLVDLDSTNHTKLEGERLPAMQPRRLLDGDTIKICRFTFIYGLGELAGEGTPTILETIDVLSASGRPLARANAEEKLRVVIEIVRVLVGVLELSAVLEKVLEALFQIFPQAERGFVLFLEAQTGELEVRASKFRHPVTERSAPSRTVYDHVTREGQAILCEDVPADSRFGSIRSLEMYQVRTMLCVPLWDHQHRAIGVLQVDTRDGRSRFTQDDLDFVVALASTISMGVENAKLHEWDVIMERRRQEARDARAVQLSLIPIRPPDLPGYAFWHDYEPAEFVGGDYFDYQPLPGPDASARAKRWAVAVGDVAGKGMPAALLMARLSAEVRLLVQSEPDPIRLVSRLNRNLCEVGAEKFVTFLLVMVDGGRHELTVINAGHPSPMIRRADGRLDLVSATTVSMPLGVKDDETYQAATTPLGPGDVVVLFTDGVETMSLDGELLGMERLRRTIAEAPPGVASVGEAIREAVRLHSAGRSQFDDITILCFGRV
jgi:sigma-B regulation protein RsbU (phosphoserine phosphatase)